MAETIKSCLQRVELLRSVSDTARLDTELLLAHSLQKDRAFLFTWPEHELNAEAQQCFAASFARRLKGEPIAYILGQQEFWSLPLSVNTSTLIPRPETELLVELALELLPDNGDSKTVADLGTGTGAVALAIASEKPKWQVLGLEKHPDAVALSQHNARQLSISNVVFFESDWFSALAPNNTELDLIVANPPYIDAADEHLNQGDVRFEPRTALVAKDQGMGDLDHIIQSAIAYLKPGAYLLLEHGWQQADAVRALFTENGYTAGFTRQDLAGQDRVTAARCPN